jgi:hypothetical protein
MQAEKEKPGFALRAFVFIKITPQQDAPQTAESGN